MTLWQITRAAAASTRLEREQTAELLAMIYNRTRFSSREKVLQAEDFYNPDGRRRGTPLRSDNVVEELGKWG